MRNAPSDAKSFRGNRIEVEATAQIARDNQNNFLREAREVHLHNTAKDNLHTPISDQLPEVTLHSLIMGLKEKPRGYGLFIGADADQCRPDSFYVTHLSHDQERAEAVACAMGTALAHKLGPTVWTVLTPDCKQDQQNSCKCDREQKRCVTREETLVRVTWHSDQLAHRDIKNAPQEECSAAGTALEANALNACAARTVMRKSGQDTALLAPTEFDMQTYQDSLADTFDEETQEDIDEEASDDNDDDDDDDDDDNDNDDDDDEGDASCSAA